MWVICGLVVSFTVIGTTNRLELELCAPINIFQWCESTVNDTQVTCILMSQHCTITLTCTVEPLYNSHIGDLNFGLTDFYFQVDLYLVITFGT